MTRPITDNIYKSITQLAVIEKITGIRVLKIGSAASSIIYTLLSVLLMVHCYNLVL